MKSTINEIIQKFPDLVIWIKIWNSKKEKLEQLPNVHRRNSNYVLEMVNCKIVFKV